MLIGLEFAHRINIYKCKQLQALFACSMGPLIVGQTNKVFPLFSFFFTAASLCPY